MKIRHIEEDGKHYYALLSYSCEERMRSIPYATKKNALFQAKKLLDSINGSHKAKLDTTWGLPIDRSTRMPKHYL